MPLSKIEVQNYKSFSKMQKLDIRPITILLGRNNAGKSALARLPLLLETGMRTNLPEPLDPFANGVDVGGTFTDLIHRNSPHGSIDFALEFALEHGEALRVESSVQNVAESQMQVVSRCSLQGLGHRFLFEWDYGQHPEAVNNYRAAFTEGSIEARVPFAGILPARAASQVFADMGFGKAALDLATVVNRARLEYGPIRYLGPFRDRPQRLYRMPTRLPSSIGMLGEDAPSILALDSARHGGQLIKVVNRFLRHNLPGWQLGIESAGAGAYALALTPDDDPAQKTNLVDTGTGVAQVLPIFVQRAMDESNKSSSRPHIEIVEQPELHLHPSAHAQLADLYIAAASINKGVRMIIETHSETFILRVRRRIAEGQLPASDVALYFVDSKFNESAARRIRTDSLGNVEYWPDGVFSEDYEETKALADAQLRKRR